MRRHLLSALGAVLLAGPALAQDRGGKAAAAAAPADAAMPRGGTEAPPQGAPLDRGPVTPAANQAHRGGGAVLEGAPGAPAPPPRPTPPQGR